MNNPPSATRRPGRVAWPWILPLPIIVVGAFAMTRLCGLSGCRSSVDHPDPIPEVRIPTDSGGASAKSRPVDLAGQPSLDRPAPAYEERQQIDTSGFSRIIAAVKPMPRDASLAEIADDWSRIGQRAGQAIERQFASSPMTAQDGFLRDLSRAMLHHSEGQTAEAARVLEQARRRLELNADLARKHLYTVIFYQGVTALRHGENENCIECRGESSCILPISPAARHTKPDGSRRAIGYFTEYLRRFPDDLEVRWLLNLAHMTLGEYPDKVDPRYLVRIDRYLKSEFDIGKFRDIGRPRRASTAPIRRVLLDGGGFRRGRPARPRRDLLRPDPGDVVLPQQGGWDLRGPERGGRPVRPVRRLFLRPGRLQQRRPDGHLHPAPELRPGSPTR